MTTGVGRATSDTEGVLLDIDGVIVTSWRPVPGAVDAVAALRRSGRPVRFLTNTTSRSSASVARALRDVGVDLEDGDLITAGRATAELLRTRHVGATCLVLNDGSNDDLARASIDVVAATDPAAERADVVVVGSGGPGFTWDAVNRAVRALQGGAALVAMHGSMVWRTDDGVCVDGGAYVRLLEAAAGVVATTVGKPAPELFLAGARSLGCAPSAVVMVGDDLVSDVLAAQALGMTGVLVRTGKFRADVLASAPAPPDVVVDSLADVPGLLAGPGGSAAV
jgi:HAD superfamily hydrolase (TIGR01458 family)